MQGSAGYKPAATFGQVLDKWVQVFRPTQEECRDLDSAGYKPAATFEHLRPLLKTCGHIRTHGLGAFGPFGERSEGLPVPGSRRLVSPRSLEGDAEKPSSE